MTIPFGIACTVVLAALTGACAPAVHELPISGRYGSIAYDGTVMRTVESGRYVFEVVRLRLTLDTGVGLNHVDQIKNPQLRLVTTVLPTGAARSTRTSESSVSLQLTLDKDHPEATVRNVRFVADRRVVDESSYTTLGLTDGHLLWPFASQLKP